jgi:hypothetical protein
VLKGSGYWGERGRAIDGKLQVYQLKLHVIIIKIAPTILYLRLVYH